MAQKPNFLKKLISAGLVTASTATIVAGFAGSAMGANQNINANVNLGAVDIPEIVTGDSLTYVVQAGGPFTATANGENDKGGNPTVLFGSINMLQNGTFAVNGVNIEIGSVSGTAGQSLEVDIATGNTLTLNGAAGVAAFPVNTYTNFSPVKFSDNDAILKVSLAGNGADGTKTAVFGNTATFNGNAAGQGTINVDNENIAIFNGQIGNNNGIQFITLTGNAQATLNANAKFDGTVGAGGAELDNGSILNVAGGVNITGVTDANNISIDGKAANNGTVNFLGGSTVSTDIGANNSVLAVNVAGELTFQGGNNDDNVTFNAQAINLTGANSLIKFTTQDHTVIGNILNTSGTNNQGGFSVNGNNVTIIGNIGTDANNSLATINFETDNMVVHKAGANPTNALFVQNVNTVMPNTGILELHGTKYAINGNIGANNALKIVNLVDDNNGNATNFTLKQNGSIKAQTISLSAEQDNTLTLEDGTTVTGNIVNTKAAGNGTIALTGNATINGGIGVADNLGGGNALKNITLGGKNLAYGGNNIQVKSALGNGINFAANETLSLTNTTDPALTIVSDIIVAADKQGIIDGSSLTNAQTLTISGKIGVVDIINNPAQNVSLAQLSVGSSKTTLNSGDAAIAELVIGNNGSVQLGHDNYVIAKTTNAAGQGKVIFASTIVNNDTNFTNLRAGTNLGSAAAPLSEVNFAAPSNGAAQIAVSVFDGAIYANNITSTTPNTAKFLFSGGTSMVSGTVGTPASNFLEVSVLNNGTAQFAGDAIFSGMSLITGNSTLQIGGNYTTSFFSSTDNTGTVEFVNADPITVTVNKQDIPVDYLKQITVSGPGNVVINEIGNPYGVVTNTIAFANASLGTSLFLASGVSLDRLTITSTVGNKVAGGGFNAPRVIVTDTDSTIGQPIGDQNNIVGLGLASDNKITVNNATVYATLFAVNNDEGTIELKGGGPNTPGTIYGLGFKNGDPKLEEVTFTTKYNNLGSIIATNAIIEDGLTVTTGGVAGKDFDGKITLGSVNGNSNVIFVDGTNSTAASTIVTTKTNNGTVTYLGSASVGNIGNSNALVSSVKFTGPAGSLEKLLGNIYSTATNFGNVNLNVAGSNVILGGGTTAINGNINLVTNTLTFESGTSTWGSNTSLSTTLNIAADASGVIGHIVIAENAQVNVTTTGTTTISVQDNANANFSGTKEYTLIQGGARFNGTLGGPNFAVTGSNRFVNYGLIRIANQDYVITRTNNAANVVTNDIANSPFAGVSGVGQNVTTFVNSTNTAAYNNLLLAKNSADSAIFVGAITTDTSAAVTNAQLNVAKDIQAQLGNRLGALRYLGTPETAEMAGPEAGAIPAAVAAGDEAVDNVAYGIWAKPFYTDAHQEKKGGVAGYKAKTTGVVIGLDTLANDNLMIGAAIGITKTDIKHQDYKKGDKTDVNGFSFSLYGAQQLVENFFAQGSAIFSLNQVKNKSQCYFFDANGKMNKQIAAGNYDNMTFGGNLMVGYDYNAMQGVLVTPMAGLSYLKSSDENYKETGTTVANKQVNSKFSDRTDLIVGAKVAGGTMNITDLAVYPEAHAFVVHKVNGRLSKTQSQLDGQVTPFISQPDRTAKTSYNVGLSASIRPDAKMEYGIGYDFNAASKYTAHQGTLKVRVNF